MILVKERTIRNGIKMRINRIYVNTLVPQFQFKNKKGQIVAPANICVNL